MPYLHISISSQSIFISPQREGTRALSYLVKALGGYMLWGPCKWHRLRMSSRDFVELYPSDPSRKSPCSKGFFLFLCIFKAVVLLKCIFFYTFENHSPRNQGVIWLVSIFLVWFAEVLAIPSVLTNLPTNRVFTFKLPLTRRIQVLCKRKNMKQLCYRLVFWY